MKINFLHPLMSNNITSDDLSKVITALKKNIILTQNKKVEEFEKKWSKWLGVKYSVYVNSGSSSNFITFAYLKSKFPNGGEVIVPPLTWPSDIMAVINNGFKPKFVDISLKTLSLDNKKVIENINKNTKAIFITHAQGFCGISNDLIKICRKKKIEIIEDVCESHGAKYNNKKLGTFGSISNFSFYYAHHMSTIEGGMICTNNKEIYDFCVRFRGHGMLRESKFDDVKKLHKKYKDLNKSFIFLNPGFNFRNNEIGAIIGINQLKRLNKNIIKRNQNLRFFIKILDDRKFYKDFNLSGISNYAFPIIIKTKSILKRDIFEKLLAKNGIEFRRGNAGGGNQLRQPYLRNFLKKINLKNFSNVEMVHFFGYYIGNYPDLTKNKIKKIAKIINKF